MIQLSLRNQSPNTSIKSEISVYKDELTKEGVALNCAKILSAFRGTDEMFTDLLTESLKRNNFTNERFSDAVNYVIDNCPYPKPSIADFVSFDKKVKLYSHEEASGLGMSRFVSVRVNENQTKPLWASRKDFELYGLTKWK